MRRKDSEREENIEEPRDENSSEVNDDAANNKDPKDSEDNSEESSHEDYEDFPVDDTDPQETSGDVDEPVTTDSTALDDESTDDPEPVSESENSDLENEPQEPEIPFDSEDDLNEPKDYYKRVDGDSLVEDYISDDRLMPEEYGRRENIEIEDQESSDVDEDKTQAEEEPAEEENFEEENSEEIPITPAPYNSRAEAKSAANKGRKGAFTRGAIIGGVTFLAAGLVGGFFIGDDSIRGPKVAAAPTTMTPTACETFENQGFKCEIKWEPSKGVKFKELVSQSVDPEDHATEGSSITLVYSSGPEESKIPKLKGLSTREALEKLEAIGVKAGEIKEVPNSGMSRNTVIGADKKEGDSVKNGDSIILTVSNGEITADDWTGDTLKKAKESAEKRGFKVSINKINNGTPYGVVVNQSVDPNEKPDDDNEITLTVSEPNTQTARVVPNVVGQSQPDAIETLEQEGFINVNTVFANSEEESGKVIAIAPGEGYTANSIETITIVVSR